MERITKGQRRAQFSTSVNIFARLLYAFKHALKGALTSRVQRLLDQLRITDTEIAELQELINERKQRKA